MEIRFQLNPGQLQFIQSKKREAAITSGLGGGKSFALRLGLLIDALRYPKCNHCYASLSYQNMQDSAIPKFKELLDMCHVQFEEQKSSHIILVGPQRTPCFFRSQESYTNMRTVEFGSLRCDELAYWSREAYLTFLGRLRDVNGPLIMRAATTPNGLNFFYELFKKDVFEKPELINKREMIKTSTLDNLKHVGADYIDLLKSSYDDEMLKQELDGEFFAKGGRTYYAFNRDENVRKVEFNPRLPIVIGMDFNVNPMTAVAMQHVGDITYVFKEFWLENSNTELMVERIISHFGGNRGITVVPDSTGNNRKTNSSKTDIAILKESFEVARCQNPHRKDRFNNINRRCKQQKLIIDPSCIHTIEDLEHFVEEESHKTPMLGHISDALGYPEWHYFPINLRPGSSNSKVIQW